MDESKYLEHQNETMGENSFMKKLLKKRLNQKGLTLIELLAVIVILAIVAAIAIPAIANLISNQRDKSVLADASSIISAAKLADSSGACDITAAKGAAKECTSTAIGEYVGKVQGVESTSGGTTTTTVTYTVYSDSNKNIVVEYNAFGKIKNNKFKPTTTGLMTETELNKKMDS